MDGVIDDFNCAACGKQGEKIMKACVACRLVKYCNRQCQIDHRPRHKKECRKRAAELFHEELFKQPPSNVIGDCPICFLPLPGATQNTSYQLCCGKTLCTGCLYIGSYHDNINKGRVNSENIVLTCAFCRTPNHSSTTEYAERLQKRLDANDPYAFMLLGVHHKDGSSGYSRDLNKAIQCLHRAEEMGSLHAHELLGHAYYYLEGVEKDRKKGLHHWQRGAIGGYAKQRHNLGYDEFSLGNYVLAHAHWSISAGAGFDPSLENIKQSYLKGIVDKGVLESALRAHKKSSDEMKSEQRDMIAGIMRARPAGL